MNFLISDHPRRAIDGTAAGITQYCGVDERVGMLIFIADPDSRGLAECLNFVRSAHDRHGARREDLAELWCDLGHDRIQVLNEALPRDF